MTAKEDRELVALKAQSTDWLLDEALRCARSLRPDVPAKQFAVSVSFDGEDTHDAFVEMPPPLDRGRPNVVHSVSHDFAHSRQEALAFLILELRRVADKANVKIPHRDHVKGSP